MSARSGASGSPFGGGTRATIASSSSGMPMPSFALTSRMSSGSAPIRSCDLLLPPLRLGAGEVDLVQDRDDLEPGVQREEQVRERLRLDPLRRVDHEDRALARRERARHLVREVHVARRVDQVQLVRSPSSRGVAHAHGVELDRDAALALEVERVEDLRLHLPLLQRAGGLDQPVGQGGLPVVDVGDDAEVAEGGGERPRFPRATNGATGLHPRR